MMDLASTKSMVCRKIGKCRCRKRYHSCPSSSVQDASSRTCHPTEVGKSAAVSMRSVGKMSRHVIKTSSVAFPESMRGKKCLLSSFGAPWRGMRLPSFPATLSFVSSWSKSEQWQFLRFSSDDAKIMFHVPFHLVGLLWVIFSMLQIAV